MKQFTDPNLTDSPTPGPGESNVNRSIHVQELRDEITKASLWLPVLDERPLRCVGGQRVNVGVGDNEILNVAGAGCLRSMFVVNHVEANKGTAEGGRIKVYVDDESSPRIDCTIREFVFGVGVSQPYMEERHGFTAPGPSYTFAAPGGYRNTPVPFHTRLRVVFTSAGAATGGLYWQAVYHHSTTVDFNYGRFHKCNLITSAHTVPEFESRDVIPLFNGRGRGALYALHQHYAIQQEFALEGDFRVYVDGESSPSFASTGTEDLWLGSYYWYPFSSGTPVLPSGNLPNVRNGRVGLVARDATNVSAYRYFDDGPVQFESSLKAAWHNNDIELSGGEPAFLDVTVRTVAVVYSAA